ncbi:MAG: alpha/beta hydrolase-fold protein [Crocinitomicaceae bacterium]|nr:alpha/beta hydrolase-fold protein [Crocinitomicaceae bacterium]
MKQLILIFSFAIVVLNSYSQQLQQHFNETKYPYYLSLPHDSILNNNPPVMVFLHGKSLSGSNLESLKRYGVIKEIIAGRQFPAIVIAPQTNNGWNPASIKEVIDSVRSKYATDDHRLYIIGMSMGGYGTINFTGTYPNMVAAAVAMCGGGDTRLAEGLSSVPLWIRHGNKDYVVPISESQKIVNAIKKYTDKNLIFTVDNGLNHGNMERFFRGDEIYNWLFEKVKR